MLKDVSECAPLHCLIYKIITELFQVVQKSLIHTRSY